MVEYFILLLYLFQNTGAFTYLKVGLTASLKIGSKQRLEENWGHKSDNKGIRHLDTEGFQLVLWKRTEKKYKYLYSFYSMWGIKSTKGQ